MAQPFETRLATGLRSHAQNCETLRNLIAETEEEQARQEQAHAKHAADAIDVLLNPSERDDAATAADRAKRLVQGYGDALEKLNEKLEAKLASERRQSEEAERTAALEERDEIAARFAAEVPKALATLTGLFREVEANAARMKAARIYERNAEAEARDLPGNFALGSGLVDQFTAIRIPLWSGPGRAWPIDPADAQRAAIAEEEHRRRVALQKAKSPEALAAAAATRKAEEARWSRYRVTHSKPGFVEVDTRGGTAALLSVDRSVLEMDEKQVAAARAKGVTVEPAGEDDRSTLVGGFATQVAM